MTICGDGLVSGLLCFWSLFRLEMSCTTACEAAFGDLVVDGLELCGLGGDDALQLLRLGVCRGSLEPVDGRRPSALSAFAGVASRRHRRRCNWPKHSPRAENGL